MNLVWLKRETAMSMVSGISDLRSVLQVLTASWFPFDPPMNGLGVRHRQAKFKHKFNFFFPDSLLPLLSGCPFSLGFFFQVVLPARIVADFFFFFKFQKCQFGHDSGCLQDMPEKTRAHLVLISCYNFWLPSKICLLFFFFFLSSWSPQGFMFFFHHL